MSGDQNAFLRLVEPPRIEGRVPPHDLDAEAAVISCIFVDDGLARVVEPFLKPEYFYSESHRRIFEAQLAVAVRDVGDERVCIVRVASWLRANQRLEQIGGMPYLTEMLNVAPTIANIGKYAESVHECWRMRRAIAK